MSCLGMASSESEMPGSAPGSAGGPDDPTEKAAPQSPGCEAQQLKAPSSLEIWLPSSTEEHEAEHESLAA